MELRGQADKSNLPILLALALALALALFLFCDAREWSGRASERARQCVRSECFLRTWLLHPNLVPDDPDTPPTVLFRPPFGCTFSAFPVLAALAHYTFTCRASTVRGPSSILRHSLRPVVSRTLTSSWNCLPSYNQSPKKGS